MEKRHVDRSLPPPNPKLTYAVLPDPDPLQASLKGEANEASLTVLITNSTERPVQVRSITFHLPEGDRAGHLTNNASKIHCARLEPDDWQIDNESGGGRFRLTPRPPKDGLLSAGDGLFFTLSKIMVNEQPGVWVLEVDEETLDEGTGNVIRGSTRVHLAKLLPRSFVGNLNAEPLILVAGGTTTLYWDGSEQATYTIRYGDHTVQVEDRPYTYEVKNLQETTTFYLIAEARVSENTVTMQRERTVTVRSVEILEFVASPNTVKMGDTVSLTWQTQNAARCELWEGAKLIDPDAPGTTDAYQVRPLITNPTIYTLKASALGDGEATQRNCIVVVTNLKSKVIARIPVGEGPVAVAISPEGSRLYVANQNGHSISVIDPEKLGSDREQAKVTTVGVGEYPHDLVVNPAGTKLYMTNQNSDKISVIDTEKLDNDSEHALMTTIPVVEGQRYWYPDGVALSPDGYRIYVTDYEADYVRPSFSVIDAEKAESDPEHAIVAKVSMGQRLTSFRSYPDGIAFNPERQRIYVANQDSNHVFVIDAEKAESDPDNAIVERVRAGQSLRGVAVSPDGARVYVANGDSSDIFVIDAEKAEMDRDNALLGKIPVGDSPGPLAVSPDGHRLYVAHRDSNSISVIAIPKG